MNQRWLGGTLTNLTTIRKSIAHLKYIEQIEKAPEYSKMGKKELSALRRDGEKTEAQPRGHPRHAEIARRADRGGHHAPPGLSPPSAEARRLNIPTVAIVDTNANPELIDYPIAGNDDAIRAIRIILQKLVDAIVAASADPARQEEAALSGVAE